jgi:hypothetical protein
LPAAGADRPLGQAFPRAPGGETVLGPIGMDHSTYEQLLRARCGSAASGYDNNEIPSLESGMFTPRWRCRGLWTTPTDLARVLPWKSRARFRQACASLPRRRQRQAHAHPVAPTDTSDALGLPPSPSPERAVEFRPQRGDQGLSSPSSRAPSEGYGVVDDGQRRREHAPDERGPSTPWLPASWRALTSR